MATTYEVWTLPWASVGFKRKIARLPVIAGTGRGSIQHSTTAGTGTVSIDTSRFFDAAGNPRLDQIISDTKGSLIRVYDSQPDGTRVILDEWIVKRVAQKHSETRIAQLSGPPLRSRAFDGTIVYAFDYPAQPSIIKDHIWGGINLLQNPSFEEIETVPVKYELWLESGVSAGTFTISDGTDTTSGIAYNATTGTIENAIQDDITAVDDINITGQGTQEDPWVFELVDPATGISLTFNGAGLTGGSGTLTRTQEGSLQPSGWTRSQQVSFGEPKVFGNVDTFEVSDDFADDGTYSLKIDPAAGPPWFAGVQQVISGLIPGATYQLSIKVRVTNASDLFRFVIRELSGKLIETTADQSFSTGTFHTVTISDFVAPANGQVIYRFANTNDGGAGEPTNPSTFYVDTGQFNEGLAPDTWGAIVTAMMDDAAVDHSADDRGTPLDWIDYSSFTSSVDSNSVTWDGDVAINIPWGWMNSQWLDRGYEDYGYEWELVPKPGNSFTAGAQTHDLKVYNKGGRDSAPSTAINVRQGVTGGDVVKRIPDYAAVVAEGAGGIWAEEEDATSGTNFGRGERFSTVGRKIADVSSLSAIGTELLAFEADNRTAVQFEIHATPDHPRPGHKYTAGDTIPMQLPPLLPKENRRVSRINYVNTYPTRYTVIGSQIFDDEDGALELVRRLWRRFLRREEDTRAGTTVTGGGDGGVPRIVLGASNASEMSRRKSDLLMDGTNDAARLQEALVGGEAGEVRFTEGRADIDDTPFVFGSGVYLTGAGEGATEIEVDSLANIDWEFSGSDGGMRFLTVLEQLET